MLSSIRDVVAAKPSVVGAVYRILKQDVVFGQSQRRSISGGRLAQ